MKKTIGIISAMLFALLYFKAYAASLTGTAAGFSGTGSAACILMAGGCAFFSRHSQTMTLIAVAFYLISAWLSNAGTIQGVNNEFLTGMTAAFAAMLLFHVITKRQFYTKATPAKQDILPEDDNRSH